MAENTEFECVDCGNKKEAGEAPECCGKTMQPAEPLPVCEVSTTAEHARGDDLGEPCDDGRGGQ